MWHISDNDIGNQEQNRQGEDSFHWKVVSADLGVLDKVVVVRSDSYLEDHQNDTEEERSLCQLPATPIQYLLKVTVA